MPASVQRPRRSADRGMTRRTMAASVLCWLAVALPSSGAVSAPREVPGSAGLAGTHAFPVVGSVSFGRGHHDYPATDIIAACGLVVVSPVGGTVREVSRVDSWSPRQDDPSTRGGRFIAIVDRDGVRYYLAHLSSVDKRVKPGVQVKAGQPIGRVGRSGRAGGCHVHIGLSPPCPKREWWVRRGVVAPYDFVRSWQQGIDASPAIKVKAWKSTHPNACTSPTAIGAT